MAHTVIPSVNVYIMDGTKLLLGRRRDTGWMDGALCPVGGHVEPGETPRSAMQREIMEELGVTVQAEDLHFLSVAARNTPPKEYVAYEFTLQRNDYRFINAEPEKCSELVWVEVADLPDDVIEQFRVIINESLVNGHPYLELGY